AEKAPNPIRESMQLLARSLGYDKLDLRLRHPRPIYYEPPAGQAPPTDAVVMMTDRDAWNEDNPFPTRERAPRFQPPSPDDPSVGSVDEKRRGRFPIGVAVEAKLPEEWRKEKSAAPETVRVAAIGQGGLFVGKELSPATERLFLNTANWLLGRAAHLPREVSTWAYPRVELSERDRDLWHWGTQLGLPLLFAYLGVVVLLLRRLR